jgi:hypothetical protein
LAAPAAAKTRDSSKRAISRAALMMDLLLSAFEESKTLAAEPLLPTGNPGAESLRGVRPHLAAS